MPDSKVSIWISESLLKRLALEADKNFPKETGGILMGYLSPRHNAIVVTEIIDSGPKAKHGPYSFTPDYDYQEKKIEEIYLLSKRRSSYIGDWHTHPNGGLSLSAKDTRILENIASYTQARVKSPVMLLLAGRQENWEIKAWQWRLKNLLKFIFNNKLIELNIKPY